MAKSNFEDSMEKLEKIADELERGDLNLEESVIKFEEGIKLSKECTEFLESAEKRITKLVKSEDKIVEEDFGNEE